MLDSPIIPTTGVSTNTTPGETHKVDKRGKQKKRREETPGGRSEADTFEHVAADEEQEREAETESANRVDDENSPMPHIDVKG